MASVMVLFVVLLCLLISGLFDFNEGLPLQGARHKVVYSRFVRRRPIFHSNNYVDEVVEVFNTQRRPPPYAFLHDEDLTRFVRCDYDPSMPDCDDETLDLYRPTIETKILESPFSFSPTTTTTTGKTEDVYSTSPSTTSTTSSSSFLWGRRTESTTIPATTTEENINLTDNSQELPSQILEDLQKTTSTTNTPEVSEEYVDEKNEGENGNDYDEETNQDPKSKETDDPTSKTDYYDQGESAENNKNSEEETDNGDDAAAAAEAQTEEATIEPITKKAFLNWF